MSAIYDLRLAIEKKIRADKLDEASIIGQIGLRSGKLIPLITPRTSDDPAVIAKIKDAASELLHTKF